MNAEEKLLLDLLKEELTGRHADRDSGSSDWKKVVLMAQRHSVLPLLYGTLAENKDVAEQVRHRVQASARKAVQQSYHLLFLSKYIVGKMEEEGIPTALLKGVGTASFYPVPELRKAGDVDLLLLDPGRLSDACGVLEACGCTVEENQPSLHHVVFRSGEGIEIELHTMLAEPFDNNRINRYLEEKIPECREHTIRADVMGISLPVLDTPYHAYELLLHMLQHFLRSGFGLKLLCDWVVFWSRRTEHGEREKYLELVNESGVKGFSDMVTYACIRYLGLSGETAEWMGIGKEYKVENFLEEILEAEEFGKSGADRMVALRGNGIMDYVREFHHQMHLNFPKAGKFFLLWPGLWTVTLVRFLNNNRKIRKVSAFAVFHKAGQRGSIMKQIQLWKNFS